MLAKSRKYLLLDVEALGHPSTGQNILRLPCTPLLLCLLSGGPAPCEVDDEGRLTSTGKPVCSVTVTAEGEGVFPTESVVMVAEAVEGMLCVDDEKTSLSSMGSL